MRKSVLPEKTAAADLAGKLDAYSSDVRANAPTRKHTARHWATYAAAVGAGLALSSSADAAIIYSGTQDVTATGSKFQTFDSKKAIFMNLNSGDKKKDFYLGGRIALISIYGHAIGDGVTSFTGKHRTHEQIKRLSSGAKISAVGAAGPQYLKDFGLGVGFVGVEFTQGGLTSTGQVKGKDYYGWIRLDRTSTNDTAVDWAYNSVAGAPILAGEEVAPPVPEPTALSLLALGSVGVLAWRRRPRNNVPAGAAA